MNDKLKHDDDNVLPTTSKITTHLVKGSSTVAETTTTTTTLLDEQPVSLDDNNDIRMSNYPPISTAPTTWNQQQQPQQQDSYNNTDNNTDTTTTTTPPPHPKGQQEQQRQWSNNNRQYYVVGLLVFSSLYTFLFGGAFFGWGPMQLLLERHGSYYYKCSTNTTDDTMTTQTEDDKTSTCSEQTSILLQIQIIATLAVFTCPVLGSIGDKYSNSMVLIYLMIFFVTIASSMFLVVSRVATGQSVDWMLYIVFFSYGIVATITGLLTVTTGICLYPNNDQYRCRVISTLNALFDAGSITFLGFWALGTYTGMTLFGVACLYSGIAIVCFTGAFYFWKSILYINQREANEQQQQVNHDKDDKIITEPEQEQQLKSDTEATDEGDNNDSPIKKVSALTSVDGNNITHQPKEQNLSLNVTIEATAQINDDTNDPEAITSKEVEDDSTTNNNSATTTTPIKQRLLSEPFFMLCLFFGFHAAANTWYLTTARNFLSSLGDDDYNNLYLTIFTFLLPLSVCGVPVVDYVVKNYGYYSGFQMVDCLAVLHSAIVLGSRNLNVQIIGFVIFALYRCMIYAVPLSFVPNLVSYTTAGKAVGFMILSQGAFSFLNIPLSKLAVITKDGNFFVSNLIITLRVIPCAIAAWRVNVYIKKQKKPTDTSNNDTTVVSG